MTEYTKRRRGVAVLGAIALGASALLASNTAAFAAPPVPGNIDEAQETSLTIHKFATQSGTATGDPSGTNDPGFSDPVEGVVFTAYPLLDNDGDAIDLLSSEGWNGLDSVTFAGTTCEAPAGYTIDKDLGIEFGATDGAGLSSSDLPIGAYVICETDAPQTVTKRAAPFLVTVPFPATEGVGDDKVGTGWIYDVHVYPKNEVSAFEKVVESPAGLGIGAAVDFTITSTVPDIGDEDWTHFAITDTLDARLAAADPAAVVVSPAGGSPVITTETVGTAPNEQTRVVVTFTDNDWLKATAGAAIEITIKTTVASVGDGDIKNTAQQWVNNPGLDPEHGTTPPITTPETWTKWGSITLQKVDEQEAVLEGAVFQVFSATTPYPDSAAECTIAHDADPIDFVINGNVTNEIVSGANGAIAIPGLYVSDSSQTDPLNAEFRCYVLVETQAPAGFVTPTGDNAKHALAVNGGTNAGHNYPAIVNTQQAVPNLPLTGASGQLLLIVLGLATGAVVVGLVLMNRRRQNAAV